MVVEAATQMVELKQQAASTIRRYDVRNVQLGAALIIPQSKGVEVLFSLRPTRLNPKAYYNSLYDFTITSVVRAGENDVFTEHASGQISLLFEALGQLPDSIQLHIRLMHLRSIN